MTSNNEVEVVLITGANTGLGYETVRSLCQSSSQAYTILLGGRDLEKAEAATKRVQKEFPDSPSTVRPIQVDIEHDESIAQAFEQVSNEYGRVDVLINNAGKSSQVHARGGHHLRHLC
jgi:NADP-dependent 3-hydroxy acid dehydrogenase YdfG